MIVLIVLLLIMGIDAQEDNRQSQQEIDAQCAMAADIEMNGFTEVDAIGGGEI